MLILPWPQMVVEVAAVELLAVIFTAEVWLLVDGLKKRGGDDAT